MEWPPDVEGKVFELIRPHAQCGLKRRTWKAIHDQLLATVPRKVPVPRKIPWGHLMLLIEDNEAQPIDDDRTFPIEPIRLNPIELNNSSFFNYTMNPPGDTSTDANIVATQANVSLDVAAEALANHDGDIVDAIMELTL
jgi:hypothetical protein